MFAKHYNLATEGIRAGHKIFAKLGFGFQIEVTITPKDTGGGAGPGFIPDLNEYLVTVKITRKDKIWQQSFEANRFEMKSLERVMATFKNINKLVENITFAIKAPIINIRRIIVETFFKR